MKSTIHAALISAMLGTGVIFVAAPAVAGMGISLDFGDVAIGYRDGYYDSGHHWHRWHHASDYRDYAKAHPDHYRDMRHDEDHGH